MTVVRRTSQVVLFLPALLLGPGQGCKDTRMIKQKHPSEAAVFLLRSVSRSVKQRLPQTKPPHLPLLSGAGPAAPDSYKKKCSWKAGSLQSGMVCVFRQHCWVSSGIRETLNRESKNIRPHHHLSLAASSA